MLYAALAIATKATLAIANTVCVALCAAPVGRTSGRRNHPTMATSHRAGYGTRAGRPALLPRRAAGGLRRDFGVRGLGCAAADLSLQDFDHAAHGLARLLLGELVVARSDGGRDRDAVAGVLHFGDARRLCHVDRG